MAKLGTCFTQPASINPNTVFQITGWAGKDLEYVIISFIEKKQIRSTTYTEDYADECLKTGIWRLSEVGILD